MSVSGVPGSDVLIASQPSTTVPGFDVLNPATASTAGTAADTYTPSSSTSLTPSTGTSLAPSTSPAATTAGTASSLSADGIPGYSALFQSVASSPSAVTVASSQNPYILAYQQTIAASDEALEEGLGTDYAASTSAASSSNSLSGVNGILSALSTGYGDGLFQGTGGSIDTTS